MTQEMIRGTVEQAYLPSKTTDGKQRPGTLVLTTNIKLAWWPKDEEYPSWIHDVINHFGDYREIIGANIVAMGIKKDFRDGYQQYNIYNLTLIDAETRPTNVSTNIADKSIEGIVLGNGKSVGAILSEPYLEYWLANQPKGHIVSEEEHAAKALEIMNLIVPGICAMDGSRVTDVEEFENIQTEEIVPNEDSDMPDDTGAIEL
tara:strand:- start:631 stop:1239 length:609 start_codon:yes stop_codon:yes gene_type:complete